ncbi:MAG: metallophosphoesterase family protein [Acidobacteriota bacterium]
MKKSAGAMSSNLTPRSVLPGLLFAVGASLGCFEPVPDPPSGAVTELVQSGSDWRYLDDGREPPENWTSLEFNDGDWPAGPALIGYGVGDESTTLRCHPDVAAGEPCAAPDLEPTLTFYLRRDFDVVDPERFQRLRLRLINDDGAIVSLNGEVIARANMRPGVVGHAQPAASEVDDRLVWREYRFDSRKLNAGRNVLAAELHLAPGRKPTVGFDLELTGFDPASSSISRGPYLQQVSENRALVVWRTGDRVATELRWGQDPEALEHRFVDDLPKNEHRVMIEDLDAGSAVHYRVGAGERKIASAVHRFTTAPADGDAGPVRVWVTGGLGSGDRFAERTALAARRFTLGESPQLWLSLGDQAFDRGREDQFDDGLFTPFRGELATTAFYPALGNRDVRTGKDPSSIPYYLLLDLPDRAQAGGVASERESYYAVDWGPLHVVSLDTVTGNLAPDKEMLTWLDRDLEANTRPFTVVYFHHPPYSKGFFSTDDAEKSGRSFGVRQNVLPILERHGVDLVLAGRSPSYERSRLLHGHYGTSDTLEPSMVLDAGDGVPDGDGPYRKARGGQGTVYVTAGGAATSAKGDFDHPAMAFATAERGSMILDVTDRRLDLCFVAATGAVLDRVSLEHR